MTSDRLIVADSGTRTTVDPMRNWRPPTSRSDSVPLATIALSAVVRCCASIVATPPLMLTATSTTSDAATDPTGADAEIPGAANVSTTSAGATLVSEKCPAESDTLVAAAPAMPTTMPPGAGAATVPAIVALCPGGGVPGGVDDVPGEAGDGAVGDVECPPHAAAPRNTRTKTPRGMKARSVFLI